MKTDTSITFVAAEELQGVAIRVLRLVKIDDPDNLDAVELYEKNYIASNDEAPTYVTQEEVQQHSARLDQARTQSYSQVVRLYGYDRTEDLQYFAEQGSVEPGATKTESHSEVIPVNGGSSVSTEFPIASGTNPTVDLSLRTITGAVYNGGFVVDDGGTIQLNEPCYGFARVNYRHTWQELTVTGRSRTALNKEDAIVLVTSSNGADALVVSFPDVQDQESLISPNDRTFVRIWAHRNANNRVQNDPFSVIELFEVERTVSQVDIDGVTIDRAQSVTLRQGNELTGQRWRLNFDLE